MEFLNQVVRPKSDQAFVIGFDSVADLTQDFTDDTEALAPRHPGSASRRRHRAA